MGPDDKEKTGVEGSGKPKEERGRIRIELDTDMEITQAQVEAALNQAFGPGHGLTVVSISTKEETN